MIPISSRLEFTTGTDLLFGGANSEYGTFKNASRAFIKLKAYLSDKS
jgi:hypothetical protein